MADNLTFGEVVGINAKRLRGAHTMDEMAASVRTCAGIKWNSSNVAALEQGKLSPTISNLLTVSAALTLLTGARVGLREVLETDVPIEISNERVVEPVELFKWIEGQGFRTALSKSASDRVHAKAQNWAKSADLWPPDLSLEQLESTEYPPTPTEERLAKKIDVPVSVLRMWAIQLWGRPFAVERDDVAGAGASPQRKGRVTRTMLEEISKAIEVHKNGEG